MERCCPGRRRGVGPCLKPPPARMTGTFVVLCVAALPMWLPNRTIVRSSRVSPSSLEFLSLSSKSRYAFISSSSRRRSCAIFSGLVPWCDKLWWPSVMPSTRGTDWPQSIGMVMSARRIGLDGEVDEIEHEADVLDAIRAIFRDVPGGRHGDVRLRLRCHSSALTSRCSTSRTAVKYSSRSSRSRAGIFPCICRV